VRAERGRLLNKDEEIPTGRSTNKNNDLGDRLFDG